MSLLVGAIAIVYKVISGMYTFSHYVGGVIALLILIPEFSKEKTLKKESQNIETGVKMNNKEEQNNQSNKGLMISYSVLTVIFAFFMFISNVLVLKYIATACFIICAFILIVKLISPKTHNIKYSIMHWGICVPFLCLLIINAFRSYKLTVTDWSLILISIMIMGAVLTTFREQFKQSARLETIERERELEKCMDQVDNFLRKNPSIYETNQIVLANTASEYDSVRQYDNEAYNEFCELTRESKKMLLKRKNIPFDTKLDYKNCIAMMKDIFSHRCSISTECVKYFNDLENNKNNFIVIDPNPLSDESKDIIQDIYDFIHDCLLLAYKENKLKDLRLKKDWPELCIDDIELIRQDPWKYVSDKISVNINGERIKGNETLRRNAFLIFIDTLTRFEFDLLLSKDPSLYEIIPSNKNLKYDPYNPEEFFLETLFDAYCFKKAIDELNKK